MLQEVSAADTMEKCLPKEYKLLALSEDGKKTQSKQLWMLVQTERFESELVELTAKEDAQSE